MRSDTRRNYEAPVCPSFLPPPSCTSALSLPFFSSNFRGERGSLFLRNMHEYALSGFILHPCSSQGRRVLEENEREFVTPETGRIVPLLTSIFKIPSPLPTVKSPNLLPFFIFFLFFVRFQTSSSHESSLHSRAYNDPPTFFLRDKEKF